ncbi:hypothetical protein BDV95DRAFT_668818 [Massariosphaeria phaeospora]|uniref:Uncharacterized protein n=1 Tax=Massariosphaeria phaeospora TaxID=100035 RepID=A0A7C8I8C2_9PLEO|nr:hypothetical protein BDV95DRAFT_668818 [Massariosphaeria phaeospora]
MQLLNFLNGILLTGSITLTLAAPSASPAALPPGTDLLPALWGPPCAPGIQMCSLTGRYIYSCASASAGDAAAGRWTVLNDCGNEACCNYRKGKAHCRCAQSPGGSEGLAVLPAEETGRCTVPGMLACTDNAQKVMDCGEPGRCVIDVRARDLSASCKDEAPKPESAVKDTPVKRAVPEVGGRCAVHALRVCAEAGRKILECNRNLKWQLQTDCGAGNGGAGWLDAYGFALHFTRYRTQRVGEYEMLKCIYQLGIPELFFQYSNFHIYNTT